MGFDTVFHAMSPDSLLKFLRVVADVVETGSQSQV